MNYERIHNLIIERGKTRILEGYGENHHIIPKCLGGINSKDNIVKLTAKEHFIVHKLLCEIYPNETKLKQAVWLMYNLKNTHQTRDYKISASEYDRLKRYAIDNNLFTTNGMLGKTHNKKTKQKISKYRIDNEVAKDKNNPFYGKSHTVETKNIISYKLKGNTTSDYQKKQVKKRFKNTKWYHKKDGSQLRTNPHDSRIKTEGWITGRYNGKHISEIANRSKKMLPKYNTNNKKCSINGKEFNSSKEAADYYKMNESTMRDRLLGRFRSDTYKQKYTDWYYID